MSVVFCVVNGDLRNCIYPQNCEKAPEIRRFQVFLELLGGFLPNGALHFTFLPAYLPEDSAPYICPPEDPRFAEVVAYMEKKVAHYESIIAGSAPDDSNPNTWTKDHKPESHE